VPPTSFAWIHLGLGETDEAFAWLHKAIDALREAVRLVPGSPTAVGWGWLGLALALSGDVVESRGLLERFHAMAAQAYVPPTSFAWIHLGLGETDEAFAWLHKAIDARDHMMTPIKTYWFLDPIRDDPRFAALLRKMNLDQPNRDP